MDFYINETLEPKGEEMLIKGLTTATSDTPFHRIIGEDPPEDKEEEIDNSTILQMPLLP